ncbi:MFS transporter [Primorskyibacter sp. S187A]|uniref:MFS transporter n=1 Tax=Primorskyibacter sp. S187A TaxID=3415130 RepID=UPI003C7C892D
MSPILLLTLAIATVGANSLALSPLAAAVAVSFDTSAASVVQASAVYGAATALSALTLAPRADGFGLRRSLVWALGVITIGLILSAGAIGVMSLSLGQALAGVGAGVALPVIYALAAELAPEGRESETLGRVLTGWTLSLVVGVALAAILADLVHWRGVFAGMGLMTFVLAAILAPTAQGTARTGARSAPLSALRVPGLWPALLTAALFMAAFYGTYGYLGAHMTSVLGTSTTLAGISALSYGVGFGAVAPLDRLIDRFGTSRAAPMVFGALIAVYLVLNVSAGAVWSLLTMCLVWGGVNHLGLNLIVSRLTALDRTQRGAILGLYSATTYVAMFAGVAAMRPVFSALGFGAVASIGALCIVPAALMAVSRLLKERASR